MFINRIDAGKQLANVLLTYKSQTNTVVIAIPRGGVVTGYTVANQLDLPMDIALIKKLAYPDHPEHAIGAVSLKGYLIEEGHNLPKSYIKSEVNKLQDELKDRYEFYYADQKPTTLFGKTVILVDDGVATGNTLMATISLIQQEHPRELILAVPVGPTGIIEQLSKYVHKIKCLETYDPFYSVSEHYLNFEQVTDKEVQILLNWAAN